MRLRFRETAQTPGPVPNELGLFAPPFGLCYDAACIIGQVPSEAGMKRIWLYPGVLLLGLLAIAFLPWTSTGFI